ARAARVCARLHAQRWPGSHGWRPAAATPVGLPDYRQRRDPERVHHRRRWWTRQFPRRGHRRAPRRRVQRPWPAHPQRQAIRAHRGAVLPGYPAADGPRATSARTGAPVIARNGGASTGGNSRPRALPAAPLLLGLGLVIILAVVPPVLGG